MNRQPSDPSAPDGTRPGIEFAAPVGFSGALAGAGRLYRRSIRNLAPFFLVVSAVVLAVEIGASRIADNVEGSPDLKVGLAFFVPVVAYVTLWSVAVGASGPLLADRVVGRDSSFRRSFATSRGSRRDLFSAGLFAAVIALCLVALLLPVSGLLFLALPLLYGPPVVVFAIALEKNNLQQGLSRGWGLLKGSRLRVAGVLLAVAIAIQMLKISVTQLFLGLPPEQRLGAITAGQLVTDALLLPFLAAVSLVVYLDLRARAEDTGFEDVRAERDAAHDSVTAPPATPG